MFPLRIGINTARVTLGDLRANGRIDITAIGSGVNFAQRLETACEPLYVLVGAATKSALPEAAFGALRLRQRLVKIKHVEDAIEAFELNPFQDAVELGRGAELAHRESRGTKRQSPRWTVSERERLEIRTNHGAGWVVDFSAEGLSVVLPRYLGQGVSVEVEFLSAAVTAKLEKMGIHPVFYEVRWAAATGAPRETKHGLALRQYSAAHREILLRALRAHRPVSSRSTRTRAA